MLLSYCRVSHSVRLGGLQSNPTYGSTLLFLEKADNISFRVGEHGEMTDIRYGGGRDDLLSTEANGLIEMYLEVVHLDIKCDVWGNFPFGLEDAAADSTFTAGLDGAVIHRIIAVDFPLEQLGIEFL